jgi:hypothetical protein
MHKLPIGIQDFPKIRENGFVYVDKTELAYTLCTTQSAYFLSRPRRFGKSLLCSTLANMWAGKKEHFTGLWIEQSDWKWEKHPVVRIDLNAGNFSTGIDELNTLLRTTIIECAKDTGVVLEESATTISSMFANLLKAIHLKYNKKVAVIIDEYDKPLLTTIDDDTLHSAIKNTLKSFYGVLKSADEHLAFLFITGVTKFSQVSVFSDLNQLVDISLDARYAALCGITQDEMEATFTEELNYFSDQNGYSREEYLQRLRNFYNGYRFSKSPVSVYNPFGLLNHFSTGDFASYWFNTGTPSFLIKLIENQNINILDIENMELPAEAFGNYRKDRMEAIPVLYQAGYLTISAYDPEIDTYCLNYPNEEVRVSFARALAGRYAYASEYERHSLVVKFYKSLRSGDVDGFMDALKPFFSGIPYDLNDQTERHYQVVFYLIFRLLGQYCRTEVKNATGRADAIVEVGDYVYCFEFKLHDTAEAALAQIDSRKYLTPWEGSGKKLVKVGVEFDKEKRNVGRYIVRE